MGGDGGVGWEGRGGEMRGGEERGGGGGGGGEFEMSSHRMFQVVHTKGLTK